MPLTEAQVEQHCRELLEPVTRYIAKTLGDEASDYTGSCLWAALQRYEESHGALIGYAKTKTKLLVIDAMRSVDGRKGSAKYTANASRNQIEDFDHAEDDEAVEQGLLASEALSRTMKQIEIAACYQRWIMIGRALCNFTPKNEVSRFKRFFDLSESLTTQQAAAIRFLPR